MLVPLFFCLHLPISLGSTRTFYNELDTGPLKSSPHKALQGSQGPLKSSPHKALSWPYTSYPPPLPLWALGPKSPYKPRRMFVPYFGLSWSTTTTTTERPYVPFSTCEHLPSYCSSYFSLGSTKPLPIQCIDVCAVDSVSALKPTLSTCAIRSSNGDLPLQCIEIIQVRAQSLAALEQSPFPHHYQLQAFDTSFPFP